MLMIKLVQTYKLEYAGSEPVGGETKLITVPDKPVLLKEKLNIEISQPFILK